MRLNDIRAVLFDLDETLIDVTQSLNAAHQAVAKNLKEYLMKKGVKVGLENLSEKIEAIDDSMNLLLEYERDKWWQFLLDQLNIKLKLAPAFKKKLTYEYWNSYCSLVKPYDDTIYTLRHLKSKGYLLGLITDTDGSLGIKKARIEKLAFSKIFDVVIIAGEDTKDTKPNTGPYLRAAELLKVSPNECVYVGDKPYTDIKGALRAGMKAILVHRRKWGFGIGNNPNLVVENLDELKSLL